MDEGWFSMIDFVYRLNDAIPSWPAGGKWTLQELAQATHTSLPHLLQYLGEGLEKDLDLTSQISQEEAQETLRVLTDKLKPEIEERERQFAERQVQAIEASRRMDDKVRILEAQGLWHQSFRTITYFAGQYNEALPHDLLISICSNAVRAGLKSGANMQELAQWLQKAVATAMSMHTKEGLAEALDLLDAYGEAFLAEDSGKGLLVLGNILAVLEEPSVRYELWETYKKLVDQLYPAN